MNEQDDFTQFNSDTFLCDDEYFRESLTFNGGNHADVLGDLYIIMKDEHRNNHRPKKALTGILSSDSDDAESISATVKPVGTNYYKLNWLNKIFNLDFGGRAKHTLHHSVKEGTSESVDASMDKKSSSSSPMVKTEKKGWFIKEEEAMDERNRKNPRYIYLMNTVISFILLVSVIGNITSASLSVKADGSKHSF
ncbi:hypothetical protein Bca101_019342 [Brassica carinata]